MLLCRKPWTPAFRVSVSCPSLERMPLCLEEMAFSKLRLAPQNQNPNKLAYGISQLYSESHLCQPEPLPATQSLPLLCLTWLPLLQSQFCSTRSTTVSSNPTHLVPPTLNTPHNRNSMSSLFQTKQVSSSRGVHAQSWLWKRAQFWQLGTVHKQQVRRWIWSAWHIVGSQGMCHLSQLPTESRYKLKRWGQLFSPQARIALSLIHST